MNSLTATKPKLGFAGVGWIGKNRLMAINEQQLAEIKTAVDPDTAAVQKLKGIIDGIQHITSFEEMLDKDIDGIVIATPSALHAEQSLAALEKGKAVFCQKPLGRNQEETARVVNAARKQDLLLAVDFCYRHIRAAQKLKEVVQSGELGSIHTVRLTFHNAYGPDKDWYYDASLAGGGCLMDLGIHLVDLLFWILGENEIHHPEGQMHQKGEPLSNRDEQVEDYVAARFYVDGNTSVQLSCSWNLPVGEDAIIEAAFYGEQGGAVFSNVGGSFYDFVAEKFVGASVERLAGPPDEWGGRAAVEWCHQLAESKQFDPKAERYVDVARALDLLYQKYL